MLQLGPPHTAHVALQQASPRRRVEVHVDVSSASSGTNVIPDGSWPSTTTARIVAIKNGIHLHIVATGLETGDTW